MNIAGKILSLAQLTGDQFDFGVRDRGERYYAQGRVSIDYHDDACVDAGVRGGKPYNVYLDRSPGLLEVDCECPYFSGGSLCKHIWATILAADAAGMIQPARHESKIAVTTNADLGDDFDFDGDEEEGRNDESDVLREIRSISSIGWDPKAKAPAPRVLPRREPLRLPEPSWKDALPRTMPDIEEPDERQRADREIMYEISADSERTGQSFTLKLAYRQSNQNGKWSAPKALRLERHDIDGLPDPADRKIMTILVGAEGYMGWSPYRASDTQVLSKSLRDLLLPMLCETGRCWLLDKRSGMMSLLKMDEGPPWEFHLEVARSERSKQYVLRGFLKREKARVALSEPVMLAPGGWVFWPDRVARLNDSNAFEWIETLRREGNIHVPMDEGADLAEVLYSAGALPPIGLPDELRYEEVAVPPQPRLTVKRSKYAADDKLLWAQLRFNYRDAIVDSKRRGLFVCAKDRKVAVRRDISAEQAARLKLFEVGLRPTRRTWIAPAEWEFSLRHLPRIVSALIAENWMVEAEGKLYKKAGDFKIEVATGVDWFELRGAINFEGATASLPALLKALKHKENAVLLDDGSIGMLPDEWLKKYGALVALGSAEGDHLRFRKNQAGLLDALLASQPDAVCDETFRKVREELRRFETIEPADPTSDFVGILRTYQREGLGWLYFLEKFGFGGCLADDMGLGKTIQALAILEARRGQRGAETDEKGGVPRRPSLVVVPRSLIFNWRQEAERFTPKMRVLDHTGSSRSREAADFKGYDLVLTTYGTLRRDAARLKDVAFDYVILDEAQAIKNAEAQTAKAARLLKCDHRLALSGTPVQNHLGELWSIFEFLNPGMLGAASVFRLTDAGGRNPSPETRELLARALRPFVLRRTKAQVAKDLPERTEETVYCELDGSQRKLYEELRDHYRKSLMKQVDAFGINKSKIMILEALLRLRQAACHPGLLDKTRDGESSAKLETLLPQLSEVLEEGHKALVFSQFTSMLAIVRKRLDADKTAYEYLDGKTRDREARVNNFQSNPDCKLFLISLKAGGLGLNLTAAEYVFLLDPWWNPAIEAQAIDRAHRIGQTRQVFAYRLIAKGTIEEKVLELQKTKKNLADSIINADNSLIRALRKEDLELLLG